MAQNTFIAGAASDLGQDLLPLLITPEARLILLDEDDQELVEMAEFAPKQIEPLPIANVSPAQIENVGAIWGEEPLHVLIDLFPLQMFDGVADLMPHSLALLESFEPALKAGKGHVIMVVPQILPEQEVALHVAEAGLCCMVDVLAEKWHDSGVHFHLLRPETGVAARDIASTIAHCAAMSDPPEANVHSVLTPSLH